MAKPKNEEWNLGESFECVRLSGSDTLPELLNEIEVNRAEFIRSAIMKYYEGKLLIDCPTCDGEKAIFSGNTKPKSTQAASKKGAKKALKRNFSFRCDNDMAKDLSKEAHQGEIMKLSIAVALSKDHVLECPTCRGVGKIIGGPKLRKSVLAKFSV